MKKIKEKEDKDALEKKETLMNSKANSKGDDIWDEIVNTVTNDK